MSRVTVALCLACVLAVGSSAQKQVKPWVEWSKKDVQKMLDDSPWGQTQVEEDTSEMFYRPSTQQQTATTTGTSRGTTVTDTRGGVKRGEEDGSALNQATGVKFRIRWLSAKPIRQALARQIALKDGKWNDQLRAFAEGSPENRAVIAVWFESNDQRFSGRMMQAFNAGTTAVLKNNTYLERKDGQRIFLQEYVSPQQNSLSGALFIFPRTVNNQPLLTLESGDVRFVSEFNKDLKLNMKYKVAEMLYEGVLEY
jgi:hypothetical protein